MARVAVALTCTAEQRGELMALARSRTEEARLVERAKIVLACLEGKRNDAVGREFGVRPNTVGLWRKRFAAAGLAGLRDRARPGKTAKYGADLRLRVLRQLELPPPKGWPVGMGLLWPPRWAPRTMRSGACCAGKASNCVGGAPGASAPTPNLRPSPPLARTSGRRYYRPLPDPAGKRAGLERRREADDPGAGARQRICLDQQRQDCSRLEKHLQTARHGQ